MTALARLDFQEIRRHYDLVDYVQARLGPGKKEGRVIAWCCPFHSEKTPSFKVEVGTLKWRCFGSCATGGDIFDFMVQYGEAKDEVEAARILIGGPTVPVVRPIEPKKREVKDFGLGKVEWLSREGNELAGQYFCETRGLSQSIVRQMLLSGRTNPISYQTLDGEIFNFQRTTYSIPWIDIDGKVVGVKVRLDEGRMYDDYLDCDPEIFEIIRADIAADEGKPVADIHAEQVLKKVYGGRYWSWGGSLFEATVYNRSVYAHCGDNGVCYRRLSHLFVVEGEIDALTMCMAGFPTIAVAARENLMLNLDVEFQNIMNLWIVSDNDAAGEGLAQIMKKAYRRSRITSKIPFGCKDPNELKLSKGVEGIQKWLYDAHRISPMKEVW